MVIWANQGKSTSSIVMLGFLALVSLFAAFILASIDYSLLKLNFSVPKLSLQVLAKFSFLLILLIIVEFAFTGGLAFNFQEYNIVSWIFQACLVINLWFAANRKWK